MTVLSFRPTDVPPTWLVCFNTACSRREDCLRYAAGAAVAGSRDHGPVVYPSALSADGECRFFHRTRLVKMAWGFRSLFLKVRHEDYAILRSRVIDLFGSSRQFYRYNRGEYRLTPERQAEVLSLFERCGYDTTDFRFDHYEEQIDFISE